MNSRDNEEEEEGEEKGLSGAEGRLGDGGAGRQAPLIFLLLVHVRSTPLAS